MNVRSPAPAARPLDGIRVLELGQLIAGPFCTRLFAEFGAEVIKIEPPGTGDPLRRWRYLENGTSLWWHVQSRGKQSVALDLRQPEGQAIARRLAAESDIVVENFRPGTMEAWGMGYEALSEANPGLVMVRISGYGQTGPYRERPGFGVIGEAVGGLRHVTGTPDRPPSRVGRIHRRHAVGAVRRHRRADGACRRADPPVAARWSMSRSTRRCSR